MSKIWRACIHISVYTYAWANFFALYSRRALVAGAGKLIVDLTANYLMSNKLTSKLTLLLYYTCKVMEMPQLPSTLAARLPMTPSMNSLSPPALLL